MPKPEDVSKPDSAFEFNRVLASRFGAVWSCLGHAPNGGGYGLYARFKTGDYWQLVLKRVNPETKALEVAFGRGATLGSALKDLNAQVSNKLWKEDRPYNGV